MKTTELKPYLSTIDTLSKRGNTFTAKQFYSVPNGIGLAQDIKEEIKTKTSRYKAVVDDWGNETFKNSNRNYCWVKFYLEYNTDLVTVINIQSRKPCQIPAHQRGTCCDPSTERFHCL